MSTGNRSMENQENDGESHINVCFDYIFRIFSSPDYEKRKIKELLARDIIHVVDIYIYTYLCG